jgi:hypothetical protein
MNENRFLFNKSFDSETKTVEFLKGVIKSRNEFLFEFNAGKILSLNEENANNVIEYLSFNNPSLGIHVKIIINNMELLKRLFYYLCLNDYTTFFYKGMDALLKATNFANVNEYNNFILYMNLSINIVVYKKGINRPLAICYFHKIVNMLNNIEINKEIMGHEIRMNLNSIGFKIDGNKFTIINTQKLEYVKCPYLKYCAKQIIYTNNTHVCN